jgi:CrcB protein
MNGWVVASVVLAGAAGAVLRYLTSGVLAARKSFPWAVLVVNVVGSTIGGVILGFSALGALSGDWRLVLLTGFCGGLTTFSTFSVETVQLINDGRGRVALVSIASNLVLGVAVAFAAFAIVTALG